MPLIMPLAAPPLSDLSNFTSEKTVAVNQSPTISSMQKDETSTEDINGITPRIPRVCLDVEIIPDIMAARLATSLLGHVLFLKNQIPFPVLQLSRLPGGKSNSRAAKLKRDLIDSFDTLSSHLDTTFTALSTAFARCSPTGKSTAGVADVERKPGSQAYMAILVGPSIGTAKSRVIFAVDGLETKIWGLRDDIPVEVEDLEVESDESDFGGPDEEEQSEESAESADDEESHSEPDDSESEDDSDAHSTSSYPSSSLTQPPAPPRRDVLSVSTIPTSYLQDHAREQQKIRAADQLLSRTLALADAEGRGMACELAPTQTHVLLRAPRRFSHPAWVPRPNFTNSMERTLTDFLEEAQLFVDTSSEGKTKNKRMQRQKVEGVWVARKTLSFNTASTQSSPPSNSGKLETVDQGQDEEDEMIWWSWDGKIIGFSSW